MRGLVIAALLGVLPVAAVAQVQGDQAPGTTQSLGAQGVAVPSLRTAPPVAPPPGTNTAAPVPSARILGVPVTADAPVSPSYDGTAYKTLGGQAETDQDAISGQVMQAVGFRASEVGATASELRSVRQARPSFLKKRSKRLLLLRLQKGPR